MRQKIQPQGFIDSLTHQEFLDGLTRHNDMLLQALGRNARFIRVVEQGVCDVTGSPNIRMGPPDGFMWSVPGFIAASSNADNTHGVNLWLNEPTNANLIQSGINTNNGLDTWQNKVLILHTGEALFFGASPSTLPQYTIVTITMFAIEVPNSHEAQLLL